MFGVNSTTEVPFRFSVTPVELNTILPFASSYNGLLAPVLEYNDVASLYVLIILVIRPLDGSNVKLDVPYLAIVLPL